MYIIERQDEEGQGLVEYALVLVLVAVAIILILTVLGGSVVTVYAQAVGGLNGQSLQKNGVEFIAVNTDAQALITDATIFMAERGEPSKNDTGTITFKLSGGSTQNVSIATNNVGLATVASVNLAGSCPGSLQIGNTGYSVPVP